jgi:hypothetical protein
MTTTTLPAGITIAPYLQDLFDVLPPMDDWDYKQLKESLSEHHAEHGAAFWPGFEPVVDALGHLVDGRNRLCAAAELGLGINTRSLPEEWSVDYTWKFAYRVNMARRHLTIDQRRACARKYLMRYPAATNREVASESGISHPTVGKIRAELEQEGVIPEGVHRGNGFQSEQTHHGSVDLVPEDDDEERSPVQVPDHRKEVWCQIIIGYPGPLPDGDPRDRAQLPYAKQSSRLEWAPPRMILTSKAPRTDDEARALAEEIGSRIHRQMREKPLKSMGRAKAAL